MNQPIISTLAPTPVIAGIKSQFLLNNYYFTLVYLHSFSKFAKFSEELTFLASSEGKKYFFGKNFAIVLNNRQGKYCNNLAIRVIPFFIVSKLSVGETILKTVLPHFSKDQAA